MSTFELCSVDDLSEGSVKEFTVGDDVKILLYKSDGTFFANSALCTHYHAPLIKGSVNGNRIRCPWHGACYNLKTGEIEDFPCWESLKSYKTAVNEGKVLVTVAAPLECSRSVNNADEAIAVIGGGGAGFTAVQTLRENDYGGRIIMISSEPRLPYYRVKLSKQPAMDPLKLTLKPNEYFVSNNIEVMLGKTVTTMNCCQRILEFSDNSSLRFSTAIVATGCYPRKLSLGNGIRGVHYLRSSDDGQAFFNDAVNQNLVVVGSGFIAFEIAASFSRQSKQVTVVSKETVPLKHLVGERVGQVLLGMHKAAGVAYICNATLIRYATDSAGKLSGVVLSDGREIPADCCLIAIGAEPASEFLRNSGLEMDDSGFILVDEFMKTNLDNVFAAGDVASIPVPLSLTGGVSRRDHIGHWPIAQKTGRVAALNALGKRRPFIVVPFLWATMYGTNIRFSGYNKGLSPENVIIHGDLENRKFVAYYFDQAGPDGRVVAVATMGMDPIASQFAELLTNGEQLYLKDIENDTSASWAVKYAPKDLNN